MNDYSTRQTLLQRLKNQEDENSWEEFIEAYRPYIYAIAQKLNIPPGEREDLIQNVLLKAWKALPGFEYDQQKGRFRNWLRRIIINCINTYYDKLKRTPTAKAVVDGEESLTHWPSTESGLDEIIELEWELYISSKAWDNISDGLNDKVRQSYLRLKDGDSAEDIARDLGLSAQSIVVYKHRVLKLLYKEILRLDHDMS
ncbi:MAG: sigma-70 family RNA polymerase sigma factor [Lentisphaeraceae bacterium]|nr:sigma-70 family RNA polymerase sigma factor [Lentisphaeraceae bacterium]